ncbi:hypothetical protein GOV10_03780 [Candidatus Woesearchaeota archaeon]|nr:hypothetical protein [Candidatus Woesearchaeota archaeon]
MEKDKPIAAATFKEADNIPDWKTIYPSPYPEKYDEKGGLFTARIKRWGNSLAIRVPNEVVKSAGLVEHMIVDLELEKAHFLQTEDEKGNSFETFFKLAENVKDKFDLSVEEIAYYLVVWALRQTGKKLNIETKNKREGLSQRQYAAYEEHDKAIEEFGKKLQEIGYDALTEGVPFSGDE